MPRNNNRIIDNPFDFDFDQVELLDDYLGLPIGKISIAEVLGPDGETRSNGPSDLDGNGQTTRGGDPVEVSSLEGSDGDDVLVLTATEHTSATVVLAHDGDDTIIRDQTGGYVFNGGAYSGITIEGGDGEDTVDYSLAFSGISADMELFGRVTSLLEAPGDAIPAGGDYLYEIENIKGTQYDDAIIGDSNANKFWGHDGSDEINGMGGADTIYGGDGNDEITGGGGNDTIYGGDGNDDISGGHGNDTIYVGVGNDTASGSGGTDTFYVSGAGDNDIDGGMHKDTVVYSDGQTYVSLFHGEAVRVDGDDTLTSIENVETGSAGDSIIGSNLANVISTGGGSDYVSGLGGNDIIDVGSGNDFVFSDDGNDNVNGGSGNDLISAGAGNDVVDGGIGQDDIRGGAGDDTLTGGADADVFRWHIEDVGVGLGQDVILDFNLNQDKLQFEEGFFAEAPDGGVNLSEVLVASDWGGGDVGLVANTASSGWAVVGQFNNVDHTEFEQRIANGTILDVELAEIALGNPGGFGVEFEFDNTSTDIDLDWGL